MRQNIFKGAIEAGDARIVELLLSEKFADIDVNQQVCLIEGRRYTPIERASILRHKDVIESLLRHHADVNRTHPDDQYLYGALDYAVPIGTVEYLGPTRVDHHIFRILLEAGGDLSLYPMQRLIKHEGDRGLVLLFISANAHRNVAKWSEWGMFHYAIDFLDDQTSMSIINIMLTVGADLNHHAKRDYLNLIYDVEGGKVNATCNLVDTAAQCGHLETVKLLLRHGALLTGDTLPCAVTSGNEDLMRLLLEEGAAINSIGSLGITPLAAAIRLQNERIVKLLKSHDALARLSDQAHFSAAMKAASEVGNIPFIEYLMQLGCKVSPEDLGYALITATREGREDFARMLIDAGADVNFDHFNEPPLLQVLKRRNAALVHLLLDADASFNMFSLEMQLAAEWGDHSVIEALIFAGADVNNFGSSSGSKAALTIAVTHQDHVLVQLLLDAGADINNTKTRLNGGTALEAAAENGDVSTARYLLDQGADPDDSRALSSATLRNAKLSDLIIERYSLRYPKGRTGFGSSVLLQAVKKGDQPAIRMMLERGLDANKLIDIDAPCHYGSLISPFGCAIVEEQVSSAESIELFLQKGCNPDGIVSQTEDWRLLLRVTALLAAVGTRNISKVELLIRYGADVNLPARGPVKRTPLQRAAEIGSIDVVELLVHNGAEVNAPAAERGGGTALQFAAIGGYFPIACTLLNLKADVDAPASKVNGRTALEGAAEHGRLDMVKFLLNKGAGSGGKDHAQFVRAIALARDNGHIPICDLLETQLAVLADFNVNDFMDWSEGRDYFSN